MYDKFFVGGDVMSFSDNGELKPVSRVTLMLDDSNSITAGDDTGREIVANCPHATQKMVNDLLRKFRGSSYRAYEAIESKLDPSAELGDGATVCGVYGAIARMSDNGSGYSTISAPGKEDLEDEFPLEGPISRMIGQQIKRVGSSITKTEEEIRAEVGNLEERVGKTLESYATLSITDEIKASVTGIEKTVNGYTDADGNKVPGVVSTVSKLSVGLDGFKVDVEQSIGTEKDGKLQTVASKIAAEFGKITLEASNSGTSSTITLKYGNTEIKSPEIKFSGFVTFAGLSGGTTTIDGACIKTGKIAADRIDAQNLEVSAAKITGKITASQIDATDLSVSAAKITGKLEIGRLPDTVALKANIPTKLGQLTNDQGYQTETGVTTIIDGRVTTDFVNALGITAQSVSASNVTAGILNAGNVSLAGALTVYDPDTDDVGGYLGYDDGFNSEYGIGIRVYAPDERGRVNGPQIVCTDGAARISYSTWAGSNLADTSVVCDANKLSLAGYQQIQMKIDGVVLANLTGAGLLPASTTVTLGTADYKWKDVYAAGTSFSALLARVAALEGK